MNNPKIIHLFIHRVFYVSYYKIFIFFRAIISGPKEVYVREGSEVILNCSVDLGEQGPDQHYRYMIN